MKPPGVFVLGMHRSGTSAVARIANLLGLSIGDGSDLMPPNAENPKGYWESSALAGVNDDLLLALGGAWSAPPILSDGWERREPAAHFRSRARRAFAIVHPRPRWVWKDPRNSITLPFWVDALDVRPVVVIVHRNPLEVGRSLERRDGFSRHLALALWERYGREILRNVRARKTRIVRYADFLKDPEREAERLRRFLERAGLEPAQRVDAIAVRSFLDRNLRHAEYTREDFRTSLDVSSEQRVLFEVFEQLTGEHDAFESPPLADETPWTGPLLAERARFELTANHAMLLERRLGNDRKEAEGLRDRIEALEAEVLGRQSLIDAMRATRTWSFRSRLRRLLQRG